MDRNEFDAFITKREAEEKVRFNVFATKWRAENIQALGDYVDPSDQDFMAKRMATQLREDAAKEGLGAALQIAARPHGSIVEMVRGWYEAAEAKRRRDTNAT